ncbi:MAG: DsbA family protein [Bifidobacteriaceae bacterium]|jgi:protein-disulfide isomerase|nr:DsbA family protein [Bifidobacteriaceae bacterium]
MKNQEFISQLEFRGKDNPNYKKLHYTLFMDFLCPYCGKFHAAYGRILKDYLDNGYIDLTIIPLAWIDVFSNGYHYSIRAAQAAHIIKQYQPEIAWDFISKILSKGVQPKETDNYDIKQGSNDTLAYWAKTLGAKKSLIDKIANIKADNEFGQKMEAEVEVLRNSQLIPGTPTLLINGKAWDYEGDLPRKKNL